MIFCIYKEKALILASELVRPLRDRPLRPRLWTALELELELILTRMIQKPILWVRVHARA